MAITLLEREQIQKVFIAMLNAAPSITYLDQLVGYAGRVDVLARDLGETSAFKSIYPAALTNEEFANKFVANFVGNTASAEAQAYVAEEVVKSLEAGVSRADTLFNVAVALQSVPDGDATFGNTKLAFENKVEVANYYAITLGGTATDLALLQGLIANVTPETDVSTPEALQAAIEATPAGTTGQTFTLTVDQNNFTGTAGSDTFDGSAAQNGAGALINTLQNVDVLDGAGGVDTLNFTEAEDKTVAATLKNIENVNVRFAGTSGNGELDLSNATGVETVTVANSVDAGLVSNLGAIANLNVKTQNQAVDFSGSTATTLNIGLDTVGKATAPALVVVNLASTGAKAAATTINYTVNNAYVDMDATTAYVDMDATTATTASTITIAATGANVLDLNDDAASAKSVTVSGTGSVDLSAAGFTGALATFNAAENSGGVTVQIDTTVKAAVTGGSGDDVVRFDGAVNAVTADSTVTLGAGDDALYVADQLASFKSVDGGEGAADIINITDGSTFTKTNVAKISNFEVLDVSGANEATTTTTTFDLSLKSFETVQIDEAVNGALIDNVVLDNVGADFTLKVMSEAKTNADFFVGAAIDVALEDDTGKADSVNLDFTIFDGNKDNAADGNIVLGAQTLTITTTTSGFLTTVLTTVATATTIAGVETINIAANVGLLDGGTTGTEAADHSVTFTNLQVVDATTINVTGDASVVLGSTGGLVKVTKVDASGSTGDVSVDLGVANGAGLLAVTYLGSEGVDTVTVSGNGDTLYTGKGADVVTLDATLDATVARDTLVYKAATDSQIADTTKDGKFTLTDGGFDVITNFDFGGAATNDRLDVTNFAFAGAQRGVVDVSAKLNFATPTDLTSVADFFDSAAGDRGIAFATDTADGWLFIDANKDGNFTAADDIVIELAGVTTFSEVAVNF